VPEEVPRVRYHDPVAESAVHEGAERARTQAEVLVVARAHVARAAPDPWEGDDGIPDLDTVRVRPEARHRPGDLVAEGEGQATTRRDVESSVATEVVVPLPDVDVAVANAARRDLEEHLGTGGDGIGCLGRLETTAVRVELQAPHGRSGVAGGRSGVAGADIEPVEGPAVVGRVVTASCATKCSTSEK
jgi:hypothetical protein